MFNLDFENGTRVRHFSEYDGVGTLKHQTFIVIVEEDDLLYTLEYVVNLELNQWFLNKRAHYADISIKDVIVTKNFAILLGTNVHKIVYHSIMEKFITNQMSYIDEYSLSFIPGLIDSEFVIDYDH